MKKINILFLSLVILCTPTVSVAFELATHGYLTFGAYMGSTLSNANLMGSLGLDSNNNPFGMKYIDTSNTDVKLRIAPDSVFTAEIIEERLHLVNSSFTVAGWLMRGAIREDDHNELNIGVCHIDPPNLNVGDDDPHPSPPDRPIHHFYDPINDEGLFAGISNKNPDWAMGVADAFAPAMVEDAARRNHFTVHEDM